MMILKIIIGFVLSYLLGAIPTAYLFAKFYAKADIRTFGSGNVGATNAMRMMGKLPGLLVLLLDMLKGLIAVTILAGLVAHKASLPTEIIQAMFGLAVVCGHIFNIFLNFKGGKGVATSAGVLLGIAPVSVLFGGIVFIVIVGLSKYVSIGSILTALLIPFFLFWIKAHYSYIVLSAMLCIIIVFKHKANIKRLLSGREGKVFGKK